MKKFYKTILATVVAALALGSADAEDVQTLYGYQVSTPQWSDNPTQTGFISFTSTDFANVNFLKKTSTSGTHISAGEYVDGKIYAYTFEWSYFGGYEPVSYDVYNAETFERISTTSWEDKQRVIDMTYDYTTNTMYALAEDKVSIDETTGKTSLYIVNMKTGELTHVGDPGDLKAINGYNKEVENHLVTIAADENGELYSMSEYRYFFKIDKYTGAATQVGEQSKNAVNNEFQSMCFGTDGKIYWAQKHPDYGYLTTIDPTTGVQTKLGTLGDNAQVSALYVKREMKTKDFPMNVENLTAENTPGTTSVKLTWKLPTLDYAGNPAKVTSVRIYRLGNRQPIAEVRPETTEFIDNFATNGINTYNVVALNEDTMGMPTTTSVFAGYDQLQGVNNLHAVRDDEGKVTITWEAPTATVNGGYADYSKITYNVYRVNLGAEKYECISKEQKELTYVDNELTAPGTYCYVLEAVNNGVVGLGAQSEQITVVPEYAAPLKFTFEDADDGFFWTAVKNSTYGWSITAGYTSDRLEGNFAQLKSGGSSSPCNDWIISPSIRLKKGTYYLDYYVGQSKYLSEPASWEVFIGEDNTDTSKFTISVDRQENVYNAGWNQMPEKSFTVDHDGIYYLAIYGFTTSTYNTARFDNITISDSPTSGIANVSEGKINVSVSGNTATISAEKGMADWSIVNISGQAVMSGNANGAQYEEIDLSTLNAGVYIITVNTADGARFVSKIAVK